MTVSYPKARVSTQIALQARPRKDWSMYDSVLPQGQGQIALQAGPSKDWCVYDCVLP